MCPVGAIHVTVFSRDAEATRAFFQDVLELDSVDAGGGWLIFALPPAEGGHLSSLAVHPIGVLTRWADNGPPPINWTPCERSGCISSVSKSPT